MEPTTKLKRLERVERAIRCLGPDATYLVLRHDGARGSDGCLGRLNLDQASLTQALPRLEAQLKSRAHAGGAADITWPELLEGACVWVRERALEHLHERAKAQFRLRAYSPKGMDVLVTCSFRGINTALIAGEKVSEGGSLVALEVKVERGVARGLPSPANPSSAPASREAQPHLVTGRAVRRDLSL